MRLVLRAALFLLLAGASAPALAQSVACPTTANNNPSFTGIGTVFGRIYAQWNQYFGSKVDANGGTACNLQLGGSTLLGNNLSVPGALVVGGAVTMTGLLPGTQTGCMGVDVNGQLVLSPPPCGSGGSTVTWPPTGGIVISTGTNSPSGLAPVNGNLAYASGGVWGTTPLATLLASPPAIGGTTPAAGTFAALSATGAVSLTGLATGTQVACLGLDSGNHIVLSVAACPPSGGGSGTVGSGTAGQIAGYASTGTAVVGVTPSGDFVINGTTGVGTLATVNGSPGSTACSSITTNAKGLVTSNFTGTCGATITLAPGLAKTPGTYNTGTQTATNGDTVYPQLFYTAVGTPGTQAVAATDGGRLWTATAAGITFSAPNPGTVGGPTYRFGWDGTHSYSITTVGGTASIYGSCGTTGTTVAGIAAPTRLVSDGINYQCIPG